MRQRTRLPERAPESNLCFRFEFHCERILLSMGSVNGPEVEFARTFFKIVD